MKFDHSLAETLVFARMGAEDPVVCPKRQTTGYFPAPIRVGGV